MILAGPRALASSTRHEGGFSSGREDRSADGERRCSLRGRDWKVPDDDAAAIRVPDYVEPIVGWRVWYVVDVGGEGRLRSLYRPCVWPVGEPLVAECCAVRPRLWWWARHEAPVDTCTCGIYAASAPSIPRLPLLTLEPHPRVAVLGTVSLWGDVLEYEHGWRAARAYPGRLFVLGGRDVGGWSAADDIAAYRVPVEVLCAGTVDAALVELGVPDVR